MATKPTVPTGVIDIPQLNIRSVTIRIEGDSPLITHAWSEKAKRQMREKQAGQTVSQREVRDPEADFESAFYRMPDGRPAMRTIAFKCAAVDAATQLDKSITKVFLRGAFHIQGELVPIQSDEPVMREDMVRVGMGTADLRYRPQFDNWYVDLPVRYNASSISLAKLTHLFSHAGFSCGVGEWRPQKDGAFGLFRPTIVDETRLAESA